MEGDAINAGDTTNMDTISKDHSVRQIAAHGLAVGLNDGLMGNSEVGSVRLYAPFRSNAVALMQLPLHFTSPDI